MADKKFEEVANVGVRVAIVTTPPKQSFNFIMASVKAYKEGREQNWQPSAEDLANKGIVEAEKSTHYKLTGEQEKVVKRLIQTSLEKAKKEAREAK